MPTEDMGDSIISHYSRFNSPSTCESIYDEPKNKLGPKGNPTTHPVSN